MRVYPLHYQLLHTYVNFLYLEILNKYVSHSVCGLHVILIQVLILSEGVVDIVLEFVKDVHS